MKYKITFNSDWHVGNGLSDGSIADAILVRDANGLPVLPGRAVKGALREAAVRLGKCRKDLAACEQAFFGSRSQGEGFNQSGCLKVSSAGLPASFSKLSNFVGDMTILRAHTRLNDEGTAEAGSLRTLECGIPGLTFKGHIELVELPQQLEAAGEVWVQQYLAALAAGVKSLGAHRTRGYGRCKMSLKLNAGASVRLPDYLPGLIKGEETCTA
jgi:CRISPR/Cas system CMR subunit Cmr4 (Cas7 group RAMP superfamily)